MKSILFWMAAGAVITASSCQQNPTIEPTGSSQTVQSEAQSGELDSTATYYNYLLFNELPLVIQQAINNRFTQATYLKGERDDNRGWEITLLWQNQVREVDFSSLGVIKESKVNRNERFDRPVVMQLAQQLSPQFPNYQLIFVETDMRGNQEVVIRWNQEEWEADWTVSNQRVSLKRLNAPRTQVNPPTNGTGTWPFYSLLQSELPSAVTSSIESQYPNAQFIKAERDGTTRWEVLLQVNSQYWEITLSNTGAIIEKELEREDRYDISLPVQVMSTLQNRFPGHTLLFVETDRAGNQEAIFRWNQAEYEVEWKALRQQLEIKQVNRK